MSIETPLQRQTVRETLVLENGAQLTRSEFHRLYENVSEDLRAELIGGVVYMPSPLRRNHGVNHLFMSMLLGLYVGRTAATEAGDNATLLLGVDSEPQPDLYLRILPEHGRQSRTTEDNYILGAPELLIEIALTTRRIDLHRKRDDYWKYGVREYLVLIPGSRECVWFDLTDLRELAVPADHIIRSHQFPGLWVSLDAMWEQQHAAAIQVLEQGLASDEHRRFLERLNTKAS